MVFENDPFEEFKQQRQIENLERKFLDKTESRRRELDNLVRSGERTPELANRIQDEMQQFFSESQEHVSRLINEGDHSDSPDLEAKVQNEMADFFRESTETAQDLLTRLCESDSEGEDNDLADRMVNHLKNVFQQSMDHIAEVRERYGSQAAAPPEDAPEVTDLADMVQAINESLEGSDTFRHHDDPPARPPSPARTAPPPPQARITPPAPPPTRAPAKESAALRITKGMVPAPAPQAARGGRSNRRMESDGDGDGDDSSQASHRILRRQKHLPAGKSRRLGLSFQELAEIRALKELLIEKGIITREEIDELKARFVTGPQSD